MNATGTARYQIEGLDENGQWSWMNVSADKVEANTMFETQADAQSALVTLAEMYECDESELRIVELGA